MSLMVEKKFLRVWQKSVQQYLDAQTVILLTEAAVLPVVAITPEIALSVMNHGYHKVGLIPVTFNRFKTRQDLFFILFIHLHIYTF